MIKLSSHTGYYTNLRPFTNVVVIYSKNLHVCFMFISYMTRIYAVTIVALRVCVGSGELYNKQFNDITDDDVMVT